MVRLKSVELGKATSLSQVWEMKMMERPPDKRLPKVANNAFDSCGVKTAVGSSKIRMRALR